jgi:hypothetical protein
MHIISGKPLALACALSAAALAQQGGTAGVQKIAATSPCAHLAPSADSLASRALLRVGVTLAFRAPLAHAPILGIAALRDAAACVMSLGVRLRARLGESGRSQ